MVLLHMFMYREMFTYGVDTESTIHSFFSLVRQLILEVEKSCWSAMCLTTIVVASMVSHLIFYFHGLNFVNPNSLANIVRQFMP